MKKIILASTSPRRRELLNKKNIDFTVIRPNFDENIQNKVFSYELVENTAKSKAESVMTKVKENSVIISADTVVIFNNMILGKPKDFDEAYKMLSMLSSETHKVVTSVCLIDMDTNKKIIKSETSEVSFNEISQQNIKEYINKYKPYDKAGSYGIQELPNGFVREINGDYDNIVGLPTSLLINMLNEINNS